MKLAIILATAAALVVAAPAPGTDGTACFVKRSDGLYERSTQCHYKKDTLDTQGCLLKREDGLYERGHGCGYYD